jgi:hypothetical protein
MSNTLTHTYARRALTALLLTLLYFSPRTHAQQTTPTQRPAFADADARARLRRDAEARGTRITLAPCEHAEGFALSYAPRQN